MELCQVLLIVGGVLLLGAHDSSGKSSQREAFVKIHVFRSVTEDNVHQSQTHVAQSW